MARALLGHIAAPNAQILANEVLRLRRRVAELESELDQLRTERGDTVHELDLELHRLAGAAEPALA